MLRIYFEVPGIGERPMQRERWGTVWTTHTNDGFEDRSTSCWMVAVVSCYIRIAVRTCAVAVVFRRHQLRSRTRECRYVLACTRTRGTCYMLVSVVAATQCQKFTYLRRTPKRSSPGSRECFPAEEPCHHHQRLISPPSQHQTRRQHQHQQQQAL